MTKNALPSGKKLEVKPLPWEEAFTVFQEVSDVLASIEINLPDGMDIQKELMSGNIEMILHLKTPLFKLLSNTTVRAAAEKCLSGNRCTIDDKNLKLEYFEENRGDYLPAAFYALQANLLPFGTGLTSLL